MYVFFCVRAGRYAKVWVGGEINGVTVAINCFTAAHERMWQQERDIYRSPGMNNHPNVARFFGATQIGTGNDRTMWIVIQYYPHGSIYDYLKGELFRLFLIINVHLQLQYK